MRTGAFGAGGASVQRLTHSKVTRSAVPNVRAASAGVTAKTGSPRHPRIGSAWVFHSLDGSKATTAMSPRAAISTISFA